MKPPFGMDAEVTTSVQMLRGGATRGMVAQHLERQGVPRHLCSDIVSSAQKIVHSRERVIACLIGAAGLLVIAAGVSLFYLFHVNGRVAVKPAVMIAMTGLILTMYGFVDALRERK